MKKKDWIIIAAVVVVAAAGFLLTRGFASTQTGGHIDILVGDKLYERVPLGKAQTVVVEQADGKRNEVEITKNGAYMKFSTCDNQQCVHQGEVNLDNYETRALFNWIICLPNQVTIELVPEEDGA